MIALPPPLTPPPPRLSSMEVCWLVSKYMHRELNVEKYNTHITFAAAAAGLSFMARMMQGSAIDLTESVVYEISGTISELFMADCLLRGETLANDKVKKVGAMKKKITSFSERSGQIAPDPGSEQSEDRDISDQDRENEESADRQHFCASALVIMSITEGTSIFASSAFWMILNVAPGGPGSSSIPLSQSIVNLAIMLFGELVLTDGIIAYMARHSARYRNDPALEWAEYKKRKRLMVGISAVVTVLTTAYTTIPIEGFCYTATGDDTWNFATCPAPPQNITELSRVGESFEGIWWKMRNATLSD